MRKLTTLLAGWFLVVATVGCSNMQERRWGKCAAGGALLGATLGGLGGGLGVSEGANDPDDSDIAAGAGGGALAGAALGLLLGHYLCDPVAEVPPPPVAAPAPPPAKGTKLGVVGAAHFDFDRAELKPAGEDVLAGVVRTMQDHPDLRVAVEGHADSVGSDAYNLRLSDRRAQAVKSSLVRRGIESSRITTRGLGESSPIASNQTEAGRAENRRAEIIAQ